MNGATEHIEDLIGRYIVGEATETQIRELEDWCALSPDNQRYLDDARLIFEKATLSGEVDFDTEKAWANVRSRIDNKGKTRLFSPMWSIAASLFLVFGLSLLFFKPWLKREEFQFVSENEVQTHLMPDRTEIALNRKSKVSVSYNERRKTGTIRLAGEALISIPEDKKVNWTVEAGGLLIDDIGTVFQVNANPEKIIFEVSVLEGMVRLYTKETEGITISAGEKATYNRLDATFAKVEADPNVASFKTKNFDFQEDSLSEIVVKLQEVYGKAIVLEGPIESCKLTVAFENESLETILTIISETLGLEVQEAQEKIIIKGNGCF
jgi:ferric-dicitrate binding protein FerR (iron transport regulator)